MTQYEMVEKLSEKMGVTLEEAKAALEACDWEMLDAALLLEKQRGDKAQEAYSTRQAEEETPREKAKERRRGVAEGLGELARGLFNLGNRNHFEVRRGEETVLEVPVTVLVLLLVFAFWVCIPLLVIGLFTGYRYAFTGAELGRESVDHAMDKAAEVVEKVKDEAMGGRE